MHELSIVTSIINIATAEAHAHQAEVIESIELDIGQLSGIEMQAFWFAWQQAVDNTMLQDSKTTVHEIEGRATCMDCLQSFAVTHYADACPQCGGHLISINQGKELRIKAITVS